ncbi:ABC-2 family transporter protein [Lacipirellula limnantheis]|uniref:ABC-2 family transporter protein n=2 Tax=Lacipirellula limnantheis TaxID=2528024 RepID=A0A517U164_9BACT|nr:ABC-2 family transporter protein [Lacipirellula limnantheis]
MGMGEALSHLAFPFAIPHVRCYDIARRPVPSLAKSSMLFGPIFQVELVAAARQRRQYLLRVIYAAIILFVLWVSYSSISVRNSYSPDAPLGGNQVSISELAYTATAFFYAFTWVQVLGIVAITPVMAAGAIATERERRTIEYLFATDLSNFEIVVGKTFARLAVVGQLVLVSLPILFIFRLLGGIPADLLMASFLIAGSTALFLTSLSVCVSVWSARARDAVMRVYRLLAVLIVIPIVLAPLAFVIQAQNLGGTWWATAFNQVLGYCWDLNPLAVLAKSMSGIAAAGAGFDFEPVLYMAAWHVGLSATLVALATTAVRRVHLRESSRGDGAAKRKRGEAVRWSDRYRWRPQLGENAMLWKEVFAPTAKARLGFVGVAANVIVVLVALGLTFFFFYLAVTNDPNFDDDDFFYFAAVETTILGVCFMLLLAARAAGLVTLERERDCWTSLLSTPLSGGEIMRAKLVGNLYAARWGYLLLLITWLLAACFDGRYLLVIPLLTLSFFLCTMFVTVVGLQYSLSSATSLRAMGAALATVFFVGGGYFIFCCFGFVAVGGGGNEDDLLAIGMAPLLPYIVSAPAFLFASGTDEWGKGQPMMAYLLGTAGYAVADLLLAINLFSSFDRRAGRTVDSPSGHTVQP